MLLPLPAPKMKGSKSVEEALRQRRSVRRYQAQPLTLDQLSQLLWAAQGLTTDRFRTAPSAGATYPLELLVVVGNEGVATVDSGIYQYRVPEHALCLKRPGDWREELCRAAGNQRFVLAAPLTVAIAALFSRTSDGYGRRGEQYVHFEVGHAAQSLHLQAVALGLGSVPVGAFDDGAVARVLALEAATKPLYLIPVGKPR